MTRSATDTVDLLAAQIRRHRDLYYQGQPEIPDAEFDALEDRLRQLAPDHPVLAEVGTAPDAANDLVVPVEVPDVTSSHPDELAIQLQTWSDGFYDGREVDPALYKAHYLALSNARPDHSTLMEVVPPRGLEWPKSAHELPMGSLNKVNTEEELRAWSARCDELASDLELDVVSDDLALTEKLDGISIELLYDGCRFETAITRGDGIVGERIGPNVKRMRGVPESIPHSRRVSVRGEIILRRSDVPEFSRFKKAVDPSFERVKSLRNMAAGIARTKDVKHLPGCRFLTALFYEVEGVDELEDEVSKIEWLKEQGFLSPLLAIGNTDEVVKLHEAYESKRRAELDYEIDGLVIRANRLRAFHLLGELNRRPRAAVAYKFAHEMQVTELKSVLWSTGDSGRITPIAQIDPVLLAGAEVRQASLHNVAKVSAMGIGPGDQVLVSRRGDVIPYVEKVVVSAGYPEAVPAECGVCGTAVHMDGEYLLCPNERCPARMRGRIKTWIRQLGLLEWGEKTIETLFARGLVHEPADLYRLGLDDITAIRGFGETTARKLLDPLLAYRDIPLPIFIAALAIPAVSRETGKLLVRAGYDTIEKLLAASVEELAEVDGLGAIKGEKIREGLAARAEEIRRLAEVGVQPVAPDDGGALHGLSFCFSGALQRPRKELVQLVETHGGTVSSGVTKGLTFLVLGDPNSTSSKAQKARKIGTEIIDEEAFFHIVEERTGSPTR